MSRTLIFVTAVVFLATACKPFHSARGDSEAQTIVKDGDSKLTKAASLENELRVKYAVLLEDVRDPRGNLIPASILGQDYNWRRLVKKERDELKSKLSQYIALSSEVLELDARRGFYVTFKEKVISKRDSAYSFQKSLENFERIFGENFPGPKPGQTPEPPYTKQLSV